MKKILLTLFAVIFCWVTIYAQQLTEQEANGCTRPQGKEEVYPC